jgi:hypothetical protein
VDELRRRWRRFLWDGDFSGARGASVAVDGSATDGFSVHIERERGRRAVVVCNTDAARERLISVSLPGAERLSSATPEHPDARPFDGSVTVPPRSVVVVGELA